MQAAIFNDFLQYAYYSKQLFLLSAKRVVFIKSSSFPVVNPLVVFFKILSMFYYVFTFDLGDSNEISF